VPPAPGVLDLSKQATVLAFHRVGEALQPVSVVASPYLHVAHGPPERHLAAAGAHGLGLEVEQDHPRAGAVRHAVHNNLATRGSPAWWRITPSGSVTVSAAHGTP
jgi:hypothetical protein